MSKFSHVVFSALLLVTGPVLAHEPGEHDSHQTKAYGEPGDDKAGARVIELTMREEDGKMLFLPDMITVAKGEQVRFHLKNQGQLEHEFVLGTAEEIAVSPAVGN